MVKVKLTREQIQTIRNFMNNDNVLKLSVNELHRVIDGEYEVEETFEAGDWVVHSNGNIIRQIEKVERDRVNVTDGEDGYIWGISYIRHATPSEIAEEKQRRWWAKHGRKPLELKINDVLLRNDGAYVSVFDEDEAGKQYELVSRGAHANHYVVDTEHLKAFYKVICFAEDRKDVK